MFFSHRLVQKYDGNPRPLLFQISCDWYGQFTLGRDRFSFKKLQIIQQYTRC